MNDARVYVLGERAGQRVYPSGVAQSGPGGDGMGLQPMRMGDKLTQHVAQMEALNSRPLPERPPVVSLLFCFLPFFSTSVIVIFTSFEFRSRLPLSYEFRVSKLEDPTI